MKNKIIRKLLENNVFDEDFTYDDIKDIILKDFAELIKLRNRLAEPDTTIYEEDHLLLDHILDYVEIILKELE